jgi:hypothetical protein
MTLGLCAIAAGAAGCAASSQRVRLECIPEQVNVYVDGRLLESADADELILRTDEPHKIFVKGPGYEPRLVVLEPQTDAEGRTTLGSDSLCIEVVPVGVSRQLQLEVEHDDGHPADR